MIELRVRSPTGRAWLMFILSFVAAVEVLFEVRKTGQAQFFNMPFTDTELIPWIVLFALVAAIGLGWLVRLYAFPGRLVFDAEAGVVRRHQQHILRTRVVQAPAADWRVRISFFDADHRERGVFKRAELDAPGFHEVLLFTDCLPAEALARGLDAMGDQLGELDFIVERPALET